jgi:hypothetical protein
MAAVLNSWPLDFSVRLRTAGTHLNFTYVERFAVPTASIASNLPGLESQSVAGIAANHVGDIPPLWEKVWHINRSVAEAYGLSPDDLEYILSTFPVFARKRPQFYAYLLENVHEWKRETGAIPDHTYADREGSPIPRTAEAPGRSYGKDDPGRA